MKVVIKNDTNIAWDFFQDGDVVSLGAQELTATDTYGNNFVYKFLNSSNATVYEGVTLPEDWAVEKYEFDGTTWVQNADWVDPT